MKPVSATGPNPSAGNAAFRETQGLAEEWKEWTVFVDRPMPGLAKFCKDGKMYDWLYYKKISSDEVPAYYEEKAKRV